jgi:hypothetical protein
MGLTLPLPPKMNEETGSTHVNTAADEEDEEDNEVVDSDDEVVDVGVNNNYMNPSVDFNTQRKEAASAGDNDNNYFLNDSSLD